MKKQGIYNLGRIFALFLAAALSKGCVGGKNNLPMSNEGIWAMSRVSKGIVYRTIFDELYLGNRQTIHAVEIDLNGCDCQLDVAHLNGALVRTSKWARKKKAMVAINGNFFDPQEGGSVCYFRDEGRLVNQSKPDPNELLFLPMLDEGALGIGAGGIEVLQKPESGWNTLDLPSTVLSSGPLLLKDGKILDQEDIPFMNDRHARTAMGMFGEKLFLVIVDGYRPQASGMSIMELAEFLKGLGCTEAINLDGGGSSTLWLKPGTANGVVNYPSDNNRFDHKGERKVANAVLVVPNQKNRK